MTTQIISLSKYLSYILRHQPQSIGLQLDAQGWADIDELIARSDAHRLDRALISVVVETNDKQRFAISDDGRRIRAHQGHSIEVDLALTAQAPPAILLHGTAERFVPPIMAKGLQRMQRHHVHLTESEAVARATGERHGRLVLLEVEAGRMHADGHLFYRSANRVWLVEQVPAGYLRRWQ